MVLPHLARREEEVGRMPLDVVGDVIVQLDPLLLQRVELVVERGERLQELFAAPLVVVVAVEVLAPLLDVDREAVGPQGDRPLEHRHEAVRADEPGRLDHVAEVLASIVVEELHEAAVVDLPLQVRQDEHRPLTPRQRSHVIEEAGVVLGRRRPRHPLPGQERQVELVVQRTWIDTAVLEHGAMFPRL